MASIKISRRSFFSMVVSSTAYIMSARHNCLAVRAVGCLPQTAAMLPPTVVTLTAQDVLDIKRLVQTEVVHSLRGAPFQQQLRGVVDTVLNRFASQFWGTTIRTTINAPWQFSMINSTLKGAWGSVENMPVSNVSKRVSHEVDAWLALRESGAESTVADHLHYLNVFYSSKKSMRAWGRAVQLAAEAEGLVFGSGTAKHWHNTDPRMAAKRPGPLRIVLKR